MTTALRTRTGSTTARIAIHFLRQLETEWADYQESVAADRANGHRAHYCEHGTNRWTDYDNICGPCEDGLSIGDPQQRRDLAIYRARGYQEDLRAVMDTYEHLRKAGLGPFFDHGAAFRAVNTSVTDSEPRGGCV